MYKKFISAFQMLNILLQSIYSLGFPIGVGALTSFLLVKYAHAPQWIWAILLVVGTFAGLYSMVKYVLSAIKNIELIERQRKEAEAEKAAKEQLQDQLRALAQNKNDKKEGE